MDLLLSARFAQHMQLQLSRNGARMTPDGLEPAPGEPLEPHEPEAVAALQEALVALGFDLGTGGTGDGVDGDYGTLTWNAVRAFKHQQGLAVPGGPTDDGVTSVGTTTRLDEIFRHERADVVINEFVGTAFDPIRRMTDLRPTSRQGVFEADTEAGGRLVEMMSDATYVPPELDATWQAQGGVDGPLGVPTGHPFVTGETGRLAQDFEGGRLLFDGSTMLTIPPWAVAAWESGYTLGEPIQGPEPDPLLAGAERVALERGIALRDGDGNAFALPNAIVADWEAAIAGGGDLGAPFCPPVLDLESGRIIYPFFNGELSMAPPEGVPELLGQLLGSAVAGTQHLRFLVPFPSPTPRPDQIRPPTLGNAAFHAVNGDAAFPKMIDDIRRATAAGPQGFVYLADWWLRIDFSITLASGATTTVEAELLAALGSGVEVLGLLWDGGPLGWNRFNKPSADRLTAAGADVRVNGQVRPAGSHHQKLLMTFDGEQVSSWVGGIDFNEDRIRTVYQKVPGGPAVNNPGYPMIDNHVRVTGLGGFDLMSSWLDRWEATTGRIGARGRTIAPPPFGGGSVIVQACHTYGAGRPFTVAVQTAATTIEHVIRQAREYIYIEDQYLVCTKRLEAALMDRLRHNVTVIFVITPNEINEMAFGRQRRFDAFKRIATAGSGSGMGGLNVFECLSAAGSPTGPRAYTHCKVVIVDDEAATIGSTNSSNRSWTHDTEAHALFVDVRGRGGVAPGARGFARQARCDLWSEHGVVGAVSGDDRVDVPAFLAGAVGGGKLRGYDMLNRPPMTTKDLIGQAVFDTVIDPA